MNKEEQEFKEELKREFQLERMILFSDAVFAIVITLMAIEIRLPEHSEHPISLQLLHLIPTILAYAVSFVFIGFTWYQHLLTFGLLKDFNKKLVFLNLLMLFFIGLFPFSISVVTKNSEMSILPMLCYLIVIICCKGVQTTLEHYVLLGKHDLRNKSNIKNELTRFNKSRSAFLSLLFMFTLVITTFVLIKDENKKSIAWMWFIIFPLVLKLFQKKIK